MTDTIPRLRLNLDEMEKVALRMVGKRWTDAQSQAFDDTFRPTVVLQLVRDLRDAERNGRHAREAWGKAEARIAVLADATEKLYVKTVVGTEAERHAALEGAWAAIFRVLPERARPLWSVHPDDREDPNAGMAR